MSILSTNVDKKNSLETEFWIAICRQTGDKWQLKTLFLVIFDPRLSIVKSIFDCHLPGVNQYFYFHTLLDYYLLRWKVMLCSI